MNMKTALVFVFVALFCIFDISNAQSTACDVCINACEASPAGLDSRCIQACNANLNCNAAVPSSTSSSTSTSSSSSTSTPTVSSNGNSTSTTTPAGGNNSTVIATSTSNGNSTVLATTRPSSSVSSATLVTTTSTRAPQPTSSTIPSDGDMNKASLWSVLSSILIMSVVLNQ